VAPIETDIDELYQRPLGSFVAARDALARTLNGSDAKRVKALPKPTVVPWAVNQVYWHARPVYDRVGKSGAALRAAQVAALEGRRADLREARAAHQKAIGHAVAEALRLAAGAAAHPSIDQLSRTFEALTLQKTPPGEPGRLVSVPEPAGFEALSGIPIAARKMAREQPPRAARESAPKPGSGLTLEAVPTLPRARREPAPKAARDLTVKARAKQAARDQALKAAELRKADAAVRRAETAERRAQHAWHAAKRALEKAVQARARAAPRGAPVDE
jgi:hypothetical protein